MSMSNIVFTVNIENPDNPRRCKPYQLSIDSWKVWAEKNDCEVFILDQWVYDKEIMNPNWHKLLVFDLLESSGIEYDQVLIVDSDTYIHPEAPNIFEETDNKFCAVHNDGSYDWVMRSMETYSKHVFEGYMFDWSEYFNSGVMVVNKEHKTLFKDILEFYLTNQGLVQSIQNNFGVGTDQPMINFFVQKNNIDLKLLPYKWNMQDLHRKEILTEDLLFTKLGWVYHFNAIPKNVNSFKTLYWLAKTTQYFKSEFVVTMTLPSENMWLKFLNSLGDELDTWQPDYQGITQEEFLNVLPNLTEGLSPPLFLLNKECTEIVGFFGANYCGIDVDFEARWGYKDKTLYVHNYIIKKEYQGRGLAKTYLKLHIDILDQVTHLYQDGELLTYYVNREELQTNPEAAYKLIPMRERTIYHYARTDKNNVGSIKLCESLGFERLTNVENPNRVEYMFETTI